MSDTKYKKTVTLEEIANLHSLSLKTLRRWASERRFPMYKISNLIRVSPEEFFQWIESYKANNSKGGKNE